MKRILLKLSGEALAGEEKQGFHEPTVRKVALQIKQLVEEGVQVGVVIGGAFGKITSSLVDNIIMPPLSLLFGKVDFSGLFISLNGQHYDTLKAAQDAQFANTARQNYDNSRQYIADDRTLKNTHWDTPEAYEAIKRSDAFNDNVDQGLAAQWRGSYR